MFELCFHGMKVGYSNREVKSTVGGGAARNQGGCRRGILKQCCCLCNQDKQRISLQAVAVTWTVNKLQLLHCTTAATALSISMAMDFTL